MEPFRVHILGCGSALPTPKHATSSQVVEIRGKFFMIDCGEGTQTRIRLSRISFNKIQAVFISHLHGDHCFGLIGMISTFGMMGRTAPLHIYAPAPLEPLLNLQLQMFCTGLEYDVLFHTVDTHSRQVVYEDRSLTVESIPLQHRIDCCGYLFREKPTLPHIRRDMIDFYHIPLSQINNIKMGLDWICPDGTFVPNHRLVTAAAPARSYAYCSDTRYIPTLHQQLKGCTLLYHEATYDDALQDRAALYHHSTASQAAQVASDAQVRQLVVGHFSARYDNETLILQQARKVFPNTILANEGLIIDVQ